MAEVCARPVRNVALRCLCPVQGHLPQVRLHRGEPDRTGEKGSSRVTSRCFLLSLLAPVVSATLLTEQGTNYVLLSHLERVVWSSRMFAEFDASGLRVWIIEGERRVHCSALA